MALCIICGQREKYETYSYCRPCSSSRKSAQQTARRNAMTPEEKEKRLAQEKVWRDNHRKKLKENEIE